MRRDLLLPRWKESAVNTTAEILLYLVIEILHLGYHQALLATKPNYRGKQWVNGCQYYIGLYTRLYWMSILSGFLMVQMNRDLCEKVIIPGTRASFINDSYGYLLKIVSKVNCVNLSLVTDWTDNI